MKMLSQQKCGYCGEGEFSCGLILKCFFDKAAVDPRLGKSHLSVFAALIYIWLQKQSPPRIQIYGAEVMKVAKISSDSTYHRIIRDLARYGYLTYHPSYYKMKPSLLWFHSD